MLLNPMRNSVLTLVSVVLLDCFWACDTANVNSIK